ncbi:Protein Wnt-4 [Amphibalanus amphitrite]|uniref:Protein Wnt n=1 Tax=Amphibalanus amphitrite TaxID=1232801 RepID=A0A6A4WW94_AMPAM|nr:Protein Wnt-4 [Amphibalanus amphitrite]
MEEARRAPDRPKVPLRGRWCPWQASGAPGRSVVPLAGPSYPCEVGGAPGRPLVPLAGLWCPWQACAVQKSLRKQCKCHGVSGSCNIKTCWRALPDLHRIGQRLQRRYRNAIEVSMRRVGARWQMAPATTAMGRFSHEDLIYNAKSPDYCVRDQSFGSLGTVGRQCNASSTSHDGCKSMCCGRPYNTFTVERIERCQCKYVWCCYVKCKTCKRWEDVHECT